MKNTLKNIGKLLLIGLLTTIVRIIGQLLIPAGSQSVLKPSAFVENGTMPMAFTIYGIVAYTIIASLFLLIKDKISGNRLMKGLKYALSCCFIWVAYLLEPLPHVAFIDKFTYPLADSFALLVLGILSGVLLGEKSLNESQDKIKFKVFPTVIITVCFVAGRMVQYLVVGIYSSFNNDKLESILWAVVVGIILSFVLQWLSHNINTSNRIARSILVGTILFGVDLFLFNFFMPLVFEADIPDLIIRTCIDFGSVTIGCFSVANEEYENK